MSAMKLLPAAFAMCGLAALAGCAQDDDTRTTDSGAVTLNTEFWPGTASINGSVELPSPIPAGYWVQVTLQRFDSPSVGTEVQPGQVDGGSFVEYSIPNIDATGDYSIRLRVDVDGNGLYGDPGDFEGWYDGTVAAPIFDSTGAAQAPIAGNTVATLDFGIGVLP